MRWNSRRSQDMLYVIYVITNKVHNIDLENNLGKFIARNLNKISNIIFMRVTCIYFHLTVSMNVEPIKYTLKTKTQNLYSYLLKKIIYEKCFIIYFFLNYFLQIVLK